MAGRMQPAPAPDAPMTADEIARLFTRDGAYLCARWGRPVAPVMFGLADETLAVFRAATGAVLRDAGVEMAETDPETAANLIAFFVRDWDELRALRNLDRLTGIAGLPGRLAAGRANRYRLFRFDGDGAIRACITFVRLADTPWGTHPGPLAEALAVNALLTFARETVPSAPLAAVIRAAYDPVLPARATDASHALRLAARAGGEAGP